MAGAVTNAETVDPPDFEAAGVPFAGPVAAAFVATVLGYAVWAAFTGHGRYQPIRVGYGPDSAVYMRAARSPVWSFKFLATPDGGPFLFLVLAKLCLRNLRAIVMVQSVASAAAWLFLARTIASALRDRWVRTAAFVVTLLVALTPPVLVWNATIATESIAVSLLVVAIALALRVATGAGSTAFAALLVVLAGLACTRDTNEVLLITIALVALIVVVVRPTLRRRGLALLVTCVLAAGINMGLAAKAHRWYHPLTETIAVRILGSRTATDYFVAHGMPLDASVRGLHTNLLGNTNDLYTAARYGVFRTWVIDHGRATYVSFLERHPGWVFGKPYDDRRRLLAPELRYGVLSHDDPRGVFFVIGAVAFPHNLLLVEVWAGAGLIAALALARRRRTRRALIAVGVLAALVVPAFLAAWHGDALEVDRHSLSAALQLRLALWIVSFLTIDEIVTRFRSRRSARAVA